MSFEDTELLVTLNVGEIGYILCNLEDKYGQLLDGEIPEQVQTIFSKLEGAVDEHYDGQESDLDGQVYTQDWKFTDELKEVNKFITAENVTRTQLNSIKGNIL